VSNDLFAVRTEILNITQTSCSFKGLKVVTYPCRFRFWGMKVMGHSSREVTGLSMDSLVIMPLSLSPNRLMHRLFTAMSIVVIPPWLGRQILFSDNQKERKEHVERMQDERLPKLSLKYQPEGKRRTGRLRKNGTYVCMCVIM